MGIIQKVLERRIKLNKKIMKNLEESGVDTSTLKNYQDLAKQIENLSNDIIKYIENKKMSLNLDYYAGHQLNKIDDLQDRFLMNTKIRDFH